MGKKILLIEDDPLSARLADLVLQSEGYEVTIASNGIKGLKIAREDPPDLVLLDLMLPGLDGFEVLNRMRAEPETTDVKVVIVSSKSQPTDKETAEKVGADDYVTKPYRKAQLLNTVRSALSEDEGSSASSKPEEAPTEPPPSKAGYGLLLVGVRGDESSAAALSLGTALADRGRQAIVVDLRPFSTQHDIHMHVAAPEEPIALSDPETLDRLSDLAIETPGGARLLNNLEGSQDGQLTAEDIRAMLDRLLEAGDFVLVDTPLYPVDVLKEAAAQADGVWIVTQAIPSCVAATESALKLMERSDLSMEKVETVLVGSPEESSADELSCDVRAVIPSEIAPDAEAIEKLAGELIETKAAKD